ncbi:hypothetical protein BV898_14285 [Hypsibius exemplaris]|uniref:Uncharacterized protein n=1 Tax=Hypsibius exemplaris TaxID=2072580 RepID=A0A1W0W8B8_HYPEX|nr:hypothetical protein BV898_14285 [Hypsibius exemplaris]
MNSAAAMVCTGPGVGVGPHGAHQQRWRFPPWMVWGGHGVHDQHRNYRDFVTPPFIRRVPPRSRGGGPGPTGSTTDFKICDCPIICYFSMSIALILIGCLTTIFVLDDTFGHFSSMVSQLWLVGPLFISCGVVILVRTIIFLRRKQNMRRQRAELRRRRRECRRTGPTAGTTDLDPETACSRRDSFSSLPPDYEAVINGVCPPDAAARSSVNRGRLSSIRRASRGHRPSLACLNLETPPPSYDDVIRVPVFLASPLYIDIDFSMTTQSGEPICTIQNEVRRLSLSSHQANADVVPGESLTLKS